MLKKLKKSLASIKTKEIVDIVLFGSAVKGKLMPHDIDICVIFRDKIFPSLTNEIEKRAKKLNLRAHISTLIVDNFFTSPHSLIKAILNEGISLLTGKSIAEQYGLVAYSLYSYSLTGMRASEKVRFVYAVKGRKSERGYISKIGGEWIANSCFMVPIEKDDDIIELLKEWKIRYKRKPFLLIS